MQQAEADEQQGRETQRANILAAARHVFAQKGTAATMAEIAQAAGISQGLAYRYFTGKEQIYRELVQQAMGATELMTTQPDAQANETPGQRLDQLITRLVDYRREQLENVQLLQQVLSSDKPPADLTELILERRKSFLTELRQLIVAGQATGEVVADDPDQLVLAITATLEGLGRFGLQNPAQFHRLCPDARILLRMLKP